VSQIRALHEQVARYTDGLHRHFLAKSQPEGGLLAKPASGFN
jgi:hypothetical protein